MSFAEAVALRRGAARHARHGRLLHAAALARHATRAAASGRRRPTPTRAAVVEVEVDPETGWITVPQGLDRARHRPRAQPGAGARPGRGRRLHGPRRGADGGAGLPPAAAEALRRAGAQVPVDARVQEPDDARHARGRRPISSRTPTRTGPFGAKEVGQGPLLPIMPAVANAVYDAVGVRVDEVPITPEKVLRALRRRRRKGEEPRVGPRAFPRGACGRSRCACRRPGRAATATRTQRSRAQARRQAGRGGRIMMRLPWFQYRAPRSVARGGAHPRRRGAATRCWSPAAPTCCRT